MRPNQTVVLTAMLLATTLSAAAARAADDARDFTGVWQAFASAPAISSSAAAGTFTPEGEIKLADFAARYPNMIEPDSYCVPSGMPSTMTALTGAAIEITQTPTRVTLLAALQSQYRRIYIDEREYPDDEPATPMGYSIAKWEGDTLVIETRLLSEMLTGRLLRTQDSVVVERVRKMKRSEVTAPVNASIDNPVLDDNVLTFNLTISDSTLYAKPQIVTMYYQHIDDHLLLEYNCKADLWQQALDAANP